MAVQPDLAGVVQGLRTGVAVVDAQDWSIRFENGRFFQWFPPDLETPPVPEVVVVTAAGEGDVAAPAVAQVASGSADTLTARVADFPAERAIERLGRGRTFEFETEAHGTDRSVPVRLTLRPAGDGLDAGVVVEVADVSKERETQYMLDSYSSLAERHARDLEKEKERVEKLLLNIMPKAVLEELKDYGATTPQRFENASILMLDFVGFTDMAISQDAAAIITELNDIFSTFDRIVEAFNCERLKTVGDAYIAVSGVPEDAPDHAQNIARVALRMRRYLERRNAAHPTAWRARFGINTGVVIGSLVGIQKYVYDLFGPGVNLAARMEALSEPMRITVSAHTAELLADDFVLRSRGEVEVKGFGLQSLSYLEGEVGRGR